MKNPKKVIAAGVLAASFISGALFSNIIASNNIVQAKPTNFQSTVKLQTQRNDIKAVQEGITARMAEIRNQLNDEQAEQLNELLNHSRDIIDVFQSGMPRDKEGYLIDQYDALKYIKKDFTKFEELFGDELSQIDVKSVESNGKKYSYVVRKVEGELTSVVWGIKNAYEMAIKYLETEPEIILHHNIAVGTDVEIARAKLETYRQYLFNTQIELEDVPKFKPPVLAKQKVLSKEERLQRELKALRDEYSWLETVEYTNLPNPPKTDWRSGIKRIYLTDEEIKQIPAKGIPYGEAGFKDQQGRIYTIVSNPPSQVLIEWAEKHNVKIPGYGLTTAESFKGMLENPEYKTEFEEVKQLRQEILENIEIYEAWFFNNVSLVQK